jgi:hypothetical protein
MLLLLDAELLLDVCTDGILNASCLSVLLTIEQLAPFTHHSASAWAGWPQVLHTAYSSSDQSGGTALDACK